MRHIRRFLSRLFGALAGPRGPDVSDEFTAHLDLLTEENIRAGMDPVEARRQANLKFGTLPSVQESYRDQRGLPRLENFLRDLRYAGRSLRKGPGFALAVILTLAVAIGANTAIFSLVDQALLHPPGIDHPGRVIAVRERYRRLKLDDIPISAPAFADVRAARNIFQYTAASDGRDFTYTGGRAPQHLQSAAVSSEWFRVFGAKPLLGRTFTPAEDQPKANRVVILSYATWTSDFARDPSVLNRTMELDRVPYKIVGVMGPGFDWPLQPTELWIPLALPPAAFAANNRFNESLFTVARLHSGVSAEQADAWLKLLGARVLASSVPGAKEIAKMDWGMFSEPFTRLIVGDTRTAMLLLLGAVGMILLIAASNVAGLMLARNSARSHELALQAALGAGRGRLLRRTLTETLLLALVGTASGIALAFAGMEALLRWAPKNAAPGLRAHLDLFTLAFTAAIAIASGLLFGILPAWQASGILPFGAINGSARITRRQRLRSALVIAEAAMALVLMIAAGALLRSFWMIEQVQPGFDPHGVMSATFAFSQSQYPTPQKQTAFDRQLLERLSAESGIVLGAPFTGYLSTSGFEIEGRPFPRAGGAVPHGSTRFVSPGFFQALHIPLKRGRSFTTADRRGHELVAVIDETTAHRFWPGENPVGQRLRPASEGPWYTIIGVVGHILQSDLATDPDRGVIYYDLYQIPVRIPFATVLTRTSADAIRAAVASADPSQSAFDVESMEARVSASLASRRFVLRMMSFFAGTALFLAALGLYGVISFAVSQRTREIGVRMALGARSASVSGMIVGEGLRLVGLGAALGLGVSAVFARTLDSQLYHVQAFDAQAISIALVILFAVAVIASLFPARRAASVDPMTALRCE